MSLQNHESGDPFSQILTDFAVATPGGRLYFTFGLSLLIRVKLSYHMHKQENRRNAQDALNMLLFSMM